MPLKDYKSAYKYMNSYYKGYKNLKVLSLRYKSLKNTHKTEELITLHNEIYAELERHKTLGNLIQIASSFYIVLITMMVTLFVFFGRNTFGVLASYVEKITSMKSSYDKEKQVPIEKTEEFIKDVAEEQVTFIKEISQDVITTFGTFLVILFLIIGLIYTFIYLPKLHKLSRYKDILESLI